jgi:rhodanese-related sulfurtransferase
MMLAPYYLGCLAHASYLIADEQTGTAVVVDPQHDIAQYVEDAARQGLHIRYVFLTHFHGDFLAGHLELRARTGATICLGARAEADYPFTPFHDGETTERITAVTLAEQLAAPQPPVVLDVRTPREWQENHIVGSVHIPLNHLCERLDEVPHDQRLVVHCQSGYRSAIAASLLEQHGVTSLADLVGGFAAWDATHPRLAR